jgi:hypothetical protein
MLFNVMLIELDSIAVQQGSSSGELCSKSSSGVGWVVLLGAL